jgi:endonuclease YncB( thermonuclease family)
MTARRLILSTLVTIVAASCAAPVRVVEGDTLIAGQVHYRLWGIEAPDMNQVCADGWPAGAEAKRALEALVAGRRVVCEARGYDRYRRVMGLCRADGQDLGAAMVSAGLAWGLAAQSGAYLGIEQDARDEWRGVHAHDCATMRERRTRSIEI